MGSEPPPSPFPLPPCGPFGETSRLSDGSNPVSGGKARGVDLQESIHLGRHPEIFRKWTAGMWGRWRGGVMAFWLSLGVDKGTVTEVESSGAETSLGEIRGLLPACLCPRAGN